MKKLLFAVMLIMLGAGLLFGIETYYANQITVEWDAVTKLVDGSPIPSDGVVTYEVRIKNGSEIIFLETSATRFTITLPDFNKFDVGVRAVLTRGSEKFYSDKITWSATEGTPVPFYVQKSLVLQNVQNLRRGQ